MNGLIISLGVALGTQAELLTQVGGFTLGVALGYWLGNGHGRHG